MSLISLQIEHYTEEQQLTDSVTEELSECDMKGSESAAEATESKESVSLSLVDNIQEIIVQDSVPEEVTLDVILESERKIEGKDGLNTSASDITIHG